MTTGSVRQLMPSVISPPQCEQMAMTLLCSTVPPIISGRCDAGADIAAASAPRPALRFAGMTTAKSEETAAGRAGLLSGKACVVSGVGPGLRRQAAKALAAPAAHGAWLVLAAPLRATLDDVFAEVSSMGPRAIVVPTDIPDPEACARL